MESRDNSFGVDAAYVAERNQCSLRLGASGTLLDSSGPRLVVSNHDQQLDVVPKKALKSTYQLALFKNTKHTP